MPRYLQGELKLLTTQCVVIETENLGSQVFGALMVLKQYGIHKCGHESKPIPASQCILSMIGKNNPKHYAVATQDRDLQAKLRMIPGVPLLYLHNKAPVLDPPSDVSVQFANKVIQEKFGVPSSEKQTIKQLQDIKESQAPKIFKKKKRKGPNPLSCLKKKKTVNSQVKKVGDKGDVKKGGDAVEKKKRKKVRIAAHVKELLKNKQNVES